MVEKTTRRSVQSPLNYNIFKVQQGGNFSSFYGFSMLFSVMTLEVAGLSHGDFVYYNKRVRLIAKYGIISFLVSSLTLTHQNSRM